MANRDAPTDMPGTSGNKTAEHTTAEHALNQIQRANNGIRFAAFATLVLIVFMLGFALLQLKAVTERQQAEITERAKANRELLEQTNTNSQNTQYLICQVVIASYGPRPVPDNVTKICGPILANPPSGKTTFLAPGSNQPAVTNASTQQGQGASITPSVPTNSNSPTTVTPQPQPTPTPVPVVPTNPITELIQGVPIVGPLLNNTTQMVLH